MQRHSLAALALLCSPTFAIQLPEVTHALRDWRADHGHVWRLHRNEHTGYAEMLWGGSAAPSFAAKTDQEWFELARSFVIDSAALHGVDASTLVEQSVRFLPLAMAHGSTDKMTVRFDQFIHDVPVSGGRVNVLMAMDGTLLSVHSTATPFDELVSPNVALSATQSIAQAINAFVGQTGLPVNEVSAPELVVRVVEDGEERLPVMTYEVETAWHGSDTIPEGYRYWIDATTGEALDFETTVHRCDVGGSVSTMATPGQFPHSGSNPAASFPLADVRVNSSQGSAVTDANGNFNIPGASGPLTLSIEYVGPYNDVRHDSGTDYSINVTGQTGQGNNILMNPAGQALVNAQANAFRHVSSVRDYIKSFFPGNSEPDFTAVSNTNINSNCSAFYDGSSINYMTEGGGCPNTAYASVVAHEYGHWLNTLYGTGNGSDGMGEGNADVWSLYTFDYAVLGEDLFGPGTHRRTGENLRQFCGDCCGGCYGETHDDGEVWMGTAWKIRVNLNNSLGNSAGDLTADSLFLSWLNSYNQTQIRTVIETQWLALDDNDGNISNGTPNYSDINAGFLIHGFPGVDLDLIEYQNVTELGDTQDEVGPYVVDATIQALTAPPVINPTVHYRVDGGALQSVAMSAQGGDVYRGLIPGQAGPAEVAYYLTAEDAIANTGRYPDGAGGNTIDFRVGVLTVFLTGAFEGPGTQGWSSGAAGDDATTGDWTRNNPIGTGAQPEDDHSTPGTDCWFTGQGSAGGSLGENDVDDGKTTLLSPVFDADGLTDPQISYWRWYSNGTGSAPDSDIFEIDLSNNGGSSWSSIEVVGPSDGGSNGGWIQHQVAINSILPATANMRLRFIASDEGNGSIVEAALDDVEGWDLSGGGGCAAPVNYGAAKVNSQSIAAQIEFTGTNSLSVNDLELEMTTQVGTQFSVLFWGPQQNNLPFFGGTLLVGGGLNRLPLVQFDGNGHGSYLIPIDAGMVGQTRFYQWWYRDPLHTDGTGIGLSDGLQVLFCQ
ncbi:MAG: Zn-dependent metalloprotease [Planctomycetota bacterium]|jgi:Zn-dependent metalloprotease